MTDPINPNHYKGDRQFEPIEVIEDWGLNYRLGNAVKYIARNGRKPGEDPREGLRKAIWYLEREIQSLDAPGPYDPAPGVAYEDVLQYYGQTWDEDEIPFDASEEVLELDIDFGDYLPVRNHYGVNLRKKDDFIGDAEWDAPDTRKKVTGNVDIWEDFGTQQGDYATGWSPRKEELDLDWDPNCGPIELSESEIQEALGRKDLNQFSEDEIVATIDKRGFILGVKRDGTTCELGRNGKCL